MARVRARTALAALTVAAIVVALAGCFLIPDHGSIVPWATPTRSAAAPLRSTSAAGQATAVTPAAEPKGKGHGSLITKERWAKRTENAHPNKWLHAGLRGNGKKAKKIGRGVRRWGGAYEFTYRPKWLPAGPDPIYDVSHVAGGKTFVVSATETVAIIEKTTLTFPDGSTYTPSDGKALHTLVTLTAKPTDHNSWSFEITPAEGETLQHYGPQPELSAEEVAAGHTRPSYIVGGYAVWSSLGGRLFTITRAWARDATGAWTWIALTRQGNVFTKTVPQAWLDAATYPVEVDLNVGFDSIGGSAGYSLDDYVYCWQADMAGVNGTITALHLYTTGATRSMALALYTIDNVLVCQTASFASVATGWSTSAVSYDASGDVGRPYSFAWNHDGTANLGYAYDVGSAQITNTLDADAYAAPYTFPDPAILAYQFRGYKVSAYFQYTAAGGGSAVYILPPRRH